MTAPAFRSSRNSTTTTPLLVPGSTNPGDLLFWILCGGSTSTTPAGWTYMTLNEGGHADANILAGLFHVAKVGETALPDPSVFMPGLKAQAVFNYGPAQPWDPDSGVTYGSASSAFSDPPTTTVSYGPTTFNPATFGNGLPPTAYTLLSFGYAIPSSGTEASGSGWPGSGFTSRLFTHLADGTTAFFVADAVQTGGTDYPGQAVTNFVSPTAEDWCTVTVGLVSVAGTGMGMVV